MVWKYRELSTLTLIQEYIAKTYEAHYAQGKTQTLDLIESLGDAESYTKCNAIKYLSRFGAKNGKNPDDVLKAIHYCFLLYHFADLHDENFKKDNRNSSKLHEHKSVS